MSLRPGKATAAAAARKGLAAGGRKGLTGRVAASSSMVPALDLCLHPHGGFLRCPVAIRHAGFHGIAGSSVDLRHRGTSSSRASPLPAAASSASSPPEPTRYAVLGAGFAGLAVAWHLLEKSPKESPLCVDVYDEVGLGGGASGVAGGLIHPYSPKGRLLWRGAEFWRECLKLLLIAERAPSVRAREGVSDDLASSSDEQIVWRRGIVRPATTLKNAEILKENVQGCLDSCSIKFVDQDAAQKLVPGLCAPFNSAIYMPQAVNVHPRRYLQALFLACKNLADDFSASGSERREVTLYKKSVGSLQELSGSYNGVIICLGAKADMLPELSGILPLRMCRGVVAHMQLPDDIRESYESWSPSVLSDAWFAAQGPRTAILGSTWQWGSRDYSSRVSPEEGSSAFEELRPKASVVYPAVKQWEFVGASGGLRAMPPLTALGSLPLLGCVNDLVGEKVGCDYWLIGGLGARGLLYHALLGKMIAEAVISSNESALPSELTSWKKLKLAKERR